MVLNIISKLLRNKQDYSQQFIKNNPFPHLILEDFLPIKKAETLLNSLKKESFELKQFDLFTFYQTKDLVSSKNKIIQEFRSLLSSSEFVSALSLITKIKIKPLNIDIAATYYNKTHYLLPHDDQLEGRKIAFIYYLSTLNENDGGALVLYNANKNLPTTIASRIYPKFNNFIIFQVSSESFHEIEEVVSDNPRIAISGWFHGN